jgi:hypothetical protein
MPVFNFFHWSQQHGRTLTETGPLVAVEVGIPDALKQHLSGKGLPVPAPVAGFALVDTGASSTAVDNSVFTQVKNIPCERDLPRNECSRTSDGAANRLPIEVENKR